VKGLLALAAGGGIISLRNTDLNAVTVAFLLRHGIDPKQHYAQMFIESVAKATNHDVGGIATLAFAYALIRLVEGYGLWQGKQSYPVTRAMSNARHVAPDCIEPIQISQQEFSLG